MKSNQKKGGGKCEKERVRERKKIERKKEDREKERRQREKKKIERKRDNDYLNTELIF